MKNFGLTDNEVAVSRAENGTNGLTEQKSEGFWKKLIENFGDPMIKILCVALAINVVFTFLGQSEWYESAGIAIAVILATFVSTFSEYRNENAFQKLQEEASRIYCKVYRNYVIEEVSINDIVVGDCILLQSGDKIPADGIIVDGTIKVDQSVLNGESAEAAKLAVPENYSDDNSCMDFLNRYKVYRGSVVVGGNAVMKVSTVGDKSVYGQIANELQAEVERDSPLKVKLGGLAHKISKLGYMGGIAIAIAFLFQRIVVHNGFNVAEITAYCSNWMVLLNDVVDAIMLAVIIIVMAVPEGLPLMIALVSALNMGKMLKDNVLVRKISGIETAGSLNILFSDKTGTITKGKLETVTFADGRAVQYDNQDNIPEKLAEIVSTCILLNTDAVMSGEGNETRAVGGNATERAVLFYGEKIKRRNVVGAQIVCSIPFNSTNKYSATTICSDKQETLIKGAPEKILSRCTKYYDDNGNKVNLTDHGIIDDKINELAKRAIRVLALAVSDEKIQEDSLPEGEWTLVGILGIRDEVRPESAEAIKEVQNAGVQVVMITGDRQDTAIAIARESGIIKNDSDVILTSDMLGRLSDEEVKEKLKNIRVVARALPTDKSRLVRLAQELDLVVGMTGDGVNDSPALKKADVGFAMGGGTEVAKEAGDIVILDDNFKSIDKAILYGRTIFNSIRKFIIFQLTINVSAVLISFASPLLGIENPLSITQILWINLVMDTLAALAFGGEPALKRYMQEKPKKRDANIINRYMATEIFTGSIWIFILSLIFLLSPFVKGVFRFEESGKYLFTGYFSFYIFAAAFNAFNARTDKINLFDSINKNHGFWKVILLIISVQLVMTYFGGEILRCYGLVGREWILIIIMAFTIVPVDLLRKSIVKSKFHE